MNGGRGGVNSIVCGKVAVSSSSESLDRVLETFKKVMAIEAQQHSVPSMEEMEEDAKKQEEQDDVEDVEEDDEEDDIIREEKAGDESEDLYDENAMPKFILKSRRGEKKDGGRENAE